MDHLHPPDIPAASPPQSEAPVVTSLATTATALALDGADAGPAPAALTSAASSTALNPRLAPQDVDAERSVLGGVLLDNVMFNDVIEVLKPEDFYRETHRKIFVAMQALSSRGEPIDVITLADELRRSSALESVGGAAYLASLDVSVPVAGNVTRYAKIVRDKAVSRRLVEAAHRIAREGYEQKGDVNELLDSAEAQVFAITELKASTAFVPVGTAVKRVFQNLESLYERQTDITGVATGFDAFDRMTAGLQKGDLIIVGGRPSMGKTSVVMNMAAHVAIELQRPVAVFSLEMSADSLTTRMFASEARVDAQRLRTGRLLETDWPKLTRAADRLFHAPMFIDDSAGLSSLEMRAKCRRLKAKHGDLALIIVDYLQLMRGGPGADSREQEISEISRGLKSLAREMEAPVIALSQLNRSLERREDKRPQMSDLRESGAIEQDADLISFIYREEVYNKELPPERQGIAEIIIGKQRNGPTGTVRVAFLKEYTRFENLPEDQSFGESE